MGEALGARGETAARAEYESRGFDVVAQNWRCALGEIDLVLRRGDLLVFCEVKTRSGSGYGGGFEAVTQHKQLRIRRLAEAFVGSRRWRGLVRFDVASVAAQGGRLDVEMFIDAF